MSLYCAVVLKAIVLSALAQNNPHASENAEQVAKMLAFRPKQDGVACTTPSAQEQEKCKIDKVSRGGKVIGYLLRDEAGQLRRWDLDDIRAHIQRGQPVIVQVRYRSLPGRGGAYYFGDHYILVTGMVGDGFLYNDPIDIDGVVRNVHEVDR